MNIEKTNFGLRVVIPENKFNSEFTYNLRQVKTLNAGFTWHPSIHSLSAKEQIITRKFLLLAYSLENFFRSIKSYHDFNIWEQHNKANFNEFYHDTLRDLEEEITGISLQYCNNCTQNWPKGFSCCI